MDILPYFHRAWTQICTKGPFLWAVYSSLQLHNLFLVHALGDVFSWFPLEVVCIRWTYLLHGRKQENAGLELHDVGYVY